MLEPFVGFLPSEVSRKSGLPQPRRRHWLVQKSSVRHLRKDIPKRLKLSKMGLRILWRSMLFQSWMLGRYRLQICWSGSTRSLGAEARSWRYFRAWGHIWGCLRPTLWSILKIGKRWGEHTLIWVLSKNMSGNVCWSWISSFCELFWTLPSYLNTIVLT